MQTKLELYQKATPLARLGVWERNFETGEIYWNAVVRGIFEVADDFYPELQESLAFYAQPGEVKELVDRVINTKAAETGEFELISAKGNRKWVRIRVHATSASGKCVALYGTLEDITQQIEVTKILAENQEKFHQAFDYAPIGMALVSIDGKWLKVNKGLSRMLGYHEDELLSLTFQDLTHPEDLHKDLTQMHRLLNSEISSYTMEKRYFHKEGHVIWALLSVSLVSDQAGSPLYFISQVKDISESKKTAEERERTLEIVAEQNNRLLNFAHIVSHNLRSHTGNMKMLLDMWLLEEDQAEKEHLRELLVINTDNLQQTLMHLNDVIQVQSHSKDDKRPLNLLEATERALVGLTAYIRRTKAFIRVDIDSHIQVNYNPAYLDSILFNLVSNSIKYRHPDRRPEITITAAREKGVLILRVQDNGIGIDMTMHGHKLFGMYKTFHGNEDARGIGLFLTRNHIEASGGKITADSTPGAGSTFTITIH
ncbi:sensor histidine kinase [Hufsiella ginkgonis]|uniref:histidine kinase n=1 Tax=Hufsiella ginkgonis TaxID=2695274 RepID=A0A7K1Y058_9SPHI|nr:PAS domain S-box protein [Hufsiella ginkgonis]MXV16651.1 PAS domain S-box protein [Hufsiella ginkgonis]